MHENNQQPDCACRRIEAENPADGVDVAGIWCIFISGSKVEIQRNEDNSNNSYVVFGNLFLNAQERECSLLQPQNDKTTSCHASTLEEVCSDPFSYLKSTHAANGARYPASQRLIFETVG